MTPIRRSEWIHRRWAPPAGVSDLLAKSVVSFDVFETLLVRGCGASDSLFELLGLALPDIGIRHLTPSQFASERHLAYVRAREQSAPGDPELRAIYREVQRTYDWSDATTNAVMDSELRLEQCLLRPFPPGVRLLDRARSQGRSIVFTSDTYLPTEFIEDLLKRHVGLQPAERVLTSVDSSASKRHGSLFEVVLAETGASPREVIHIGNDLSSDVLQAKNHGLTARFEDAGNLNGYERVLERHVQGSGGLSSIMAGASRLTRETLRAETGVAQRSDALIEVIAGVFGPAIAGFVLWCLDQAKRSGIRRLYFLAREGEILLKVAQALVEEAGDQELHYLYVSRQSINLGQLETADESNLAWLLTDAEMDSLSNLLSRLGLTTEDAVVLAALESLGIDAEQAGSSVDPTVNRSFVELVLSNGFGLRDKVESVAATHRQVALRYLDSLGFFVDEPIGLVDVAGAGSQMRSLAALRQTRSDANTIGYLFNRYRPPADNEETSPNGADFNIRAYFGDAASAVGYAPEPYIAALLELACASNEGTVLGYEDRDGRTAPVPVLGPPMEDAYARLQALVHRGLEVFARQMLFCCASTRLLRGDVREPIRLNMRRLWRAPHAREAAALGRFRIELGSGVADRHRLVQPDTLRSLLQKRLTRRDTRPWFYWHEGSMLMSSLPVRNLYRARRWVRRRGGLRK